MKSLNFFVLTTFFVIAIQLTALSPGEKNRRNKGVHSQDKEFLFPGTGFFNKNRDPIMDKQAKEWFLDA